MEEKCQVPLDDAVETCNTLEDVMLTPDVSPEIVTKLKDKAGHEKGVAFASPDGVVALTYEDQIVWSKTVSSSKVIDFDLFAWNYFE